MIDRCGRNIDYMRISVTDRCNLRCIYCMPASGVQSFCHSDVLSYEEIVRVVRQAAALGIRHLRDRKSTRLNSSHWNKSRMPSSA